MGKKDCVWIYAVKIFEPFHPDDPLPIIPSDHHTLMLVVRNTTFA